jgi:hypothetical protein
MDIIRVSITLLCVLPICALLFVIFLGPTTNEVHLWQIRRQLKAIQPPPETEEISSHSAIGLLVGNGNHCDFFAGTVYRTQSTPGTIQAHYQDIQFLNPISGEHEDLSVTILRDPSSMDSVSLPNDFYQPKDWGLTSDSYHGGTLFLLCVMRSYDANGDFRCY